MVGADVLVSDLDYEEVKEDLKDECDKAAQAPQAVLQVGGNSHTRWIYVIRFALVEPPGLGVSLTLDVWS